MGTMMHVAPVCGWHLVPSCEKWREYCGEGVEWKGVEWSGVKWIHWSRVVGIEWSGVDWSGAEWSEMEWSSGVGWRAE